jgi:hypothetical protein
VLAHVGDGLVARNDRIAVDVVDLERRSRVKDDLEWAIKCVPRLSLERRREAKLLEKLLPRLDVLLTDGEKQRIVIRVTTNLIATLRPDVNRLGVKPRGFPFLRRALQIPNGYP